MLQPDFVQWLFGFGTCSLVALPVPEQPAGMWAALRDLGLSSQKCWCPEHIRNGAARVRLCWSWGWGLSSGCSPCPAAHPLESQSCCHGVQGEIKQPPGSVPAASGEAGQGGEVATGMVSSCRGVGTALIPVQGVGAVVVQSSHCWRWHRMCRGCSVTICLLPPTGSRCCSLLCWHGAMSAVPCSQPSSWQDGVSQNEASGGAFSHGSPVRAT